MRANLMLAAAVAAALAGSCYGTSAAEKPPKQVSIAGCFVSPEPGKPQLAAKFVLDNNGSARYWDNYGIGHAWQDSYVRGGWNLVISAKYDFQILPGGGGILKVGENGLPLKGGKTYLYVRKPMSACAGV